MRYVPDMKPFAVADVCMLIPVVSTIAVSQTSASKPVPKPKPAARRKPTGSLAQIMRGIYFPNSNLIFDVQQHDPAVPLKKSETGGTATDTYSAAYTGWEVVENAAVA